MVACDDSTAVADLPGERREFRPGGLLKRWRLRTPAQTFEVGIFSILRGTAIRLVCLPHRATLVFLPLLHLLRFFTIALGDCRFAWSSDGSLLVPDERVISPYLAAPRRCGLLGGAASGFGCLGAFLEAERERVSGPNPALARDVT